MPAAFTRSHYRSPRRSPGANLNETSCTRFLPVVARALILFLSTLTHPLARSIINSTPYSLAFPPVVDALGISRTDVAEVGDSHRSLVAHYRASRDPLVDPNANFAADAVIDIRLPDGWRSVFGNPQDLRNQRPRLFGRRWLRRRTSRCADCARGLHGFGDQRRPQSAALGRRNSDVPPRSGNLQVPIALLHSGSARDERHRLRWDGLRPPGRLLLLEQHQQPRRQRYDVGFSGPRAPAGRRRTHALQLQQAHGPGPQ